MAHKFPSAEWLQALKDKLNSDENYARVAKNWEGDIMFNIEPEGPCPNPWSSISISGMANAEGPSLSRARMKN